MLLFSDSGVKGVEENEVGVIDKLGGSKGEDSRLGEIQLVVGVADVEDTLLLLVGLADGVWKSDVSVGGGQEVGLWQIESWRPKLTGETVRPHFSKNLCLSHSCFFLAASFLYFFGQQRH